MLPRPLHSGFTLVELLVAMFIAVALYAVAVGPGRAHFQRQKLALCAENLRKLHLTLTLYANEHDGAFPVADGARSSDEAFAALVPRYSSDRSIFTCPATGHADARCDYAFAAGLHKDAPVALLASDAQVNADAKTRGAKIFADSEKARGGNHGDAGGNLLFTDGHVETCATGAARDLSLPQGAQLLNPAR